VFGWRLAFFTRAQGVPSLLPCDERSPAGRTRVTPGGDESVAAGGTALVFDFDGTITEIDLLDEISQRFGDPEVFRELDESLDAGSLTLEEVITREFAPVRVPLPDVVAWVLANARVRAGFGELVRLAHGRGWNVLVLSSGFHELIEPVLAREGVDVAVVANRLDPRPTGWRVLWRDETVCTVCGEACKRRALPAAGHTIYVGDGYSDRCAALAADRIFATRGLARYLDEQRVRYEPFDDFFDVAARLAV
jgi:2-hydroxy-3-keto-5-methylthiopentenyl-1-phosphate phosphatase